MIKNPKKQRYHVIGLVTRNTHVQYQSLISAGKEVKANVTFLKKGQGHKVKKK